MRVRPTPALRPLSRLGPRGASRAVREVLVLAWTVGLLEGVGSAAPEAHADFLAFLLCGLVFAGLTGLARLGWLPGTSRAVRSVLRRAVAGIHRFEPPAGVAFRLPEDPPPLPDRARLGPLTAAAVLLGAALAGGAAFYDALRVLRQEVSFTLHLLGLLVPWSLFLATMVFAILAARIGRGVAGRGIGGRPLVGLLGWLAAALLLAALPGVVALGLVSGAAALGFLRLLPPRPGRYFLYRFVRRSYPRATPFGAPEAVPGAGSRPSGWMPTSGPRTWWPRSPWWR